MRTSPPRAFTLSRSVVRPGTRSMSPNEQKITSGRAAMSSAFSMISSGVTHTGQPGPVHQRHLRRQQLVDAELHDGVGLPAADLHQGPRPGGDPAQRARVAARRPRRRGIRRRYLMTPGSLLELGQVAHLAQVREHLRGLGLVHHARWRSPRGRARSRPPGPRARSSGSRASRCRRNPRGPARRHGVGAVDAEDATRNGQTHVGDPCLANGRARALRRFGPRLDAARADRRIGRAATPPPVPPRCRRRWAARADASTAASPRPRAGRRCAR